MPADVKVRIRTEDQTRRGVKSADKNFMSLAKSIGGVTGAVYALKKAYDFSREGAEATRLAESGDRLAARYDTSMRAIVRSMQESSTYTIDRMSAMRAANQAMQLGVAQTPEEFEKLTKAAIALGRATGVGATQAIDNLTTGIGRQSKMILDNLGIVYDANQLYAKYAESIGKSADQLTDYDKKQALVNKSLEAAQPLLDENGELIDDQAEAYEKVEAQLADLRLELQKTADELLTGDVVTGFGKFLRRLNLLENYLDDAGLTYGQYVRKLIASGKREMEFLHDARREYNLQQIQIEKFGDALPPAAEAARVGAKSMGEAVVMGLLPAQEAIKIVREGLGEDIPEATETGIESLQQFTTQKIGWEKFDEIFEKLRTGGITPEEKRGLREVADIFGLDLPESFDETIANLNAIETAGGDAMAILEDAEREYLAELIVTLEGDGSLRDFLLAYAQAKGAEFVTEGWKPPTKEEGFNISKGPMPTFNAKGGPLTGNLAVVGEEGFEYAIKKGDKWIIIPHEQSKMLANYGVVPGAGFQTGGLLEEKGIYEDPGLGGWTPTVGAGEVGAMLHQTYFPEKFPTGHELSPVTQSRAVSSAASQAASMAATGMATAQSTTQQRQWREGLNEFATQQRKERQPMMEMLEELMFRLDRLPLDIRDTITATGR